MGLPYRFPNSIHFPAPACEKAWIFERVPGYELSGYDHRITANVVGRVECEELCLKAEDLPCRSAEYDYKTRTCRMSKETRRTQPASYRQVALWFGISGACVGVRNTFLGNKLT